MSIEQQPSTEKIGQRLVSTERKWLNVKSQEDLDAAMTELAKNLEQGIEGTPLDSKLSGENPLNDPEITKLVDGLLSDLSAEGKIPEPIKQVVEKFPAGAWSGPTPAIGWTPEKLQAIKAKKEQRAKAPEEEAKQKAAGERRRTLGELTNMLMDEDKNLNKLIAQIKSGGITGAHEKAIEVFEKSINNKLKEKEVTDEEKPKILELLKNFIEAKKDILEFHINRNESTAATMEENFKKDRTLGEIDPKSSPNRLKYIPPKRIGLLRLQAKKMREELDKYKLAA